MNMNIFDMIGPVMVGPSSSHTAGALKIASVAAHILGSTPQRAKIHLYGSFSGTYIGHGTDKAVTAGLMGFSCDDERIKTSLVIAAQNGYEYIFVPVLEDGDHPNTLKLDIWDAQDKKVSITGESTGGGSINICDYNSIKVSFTTKSHTLVIPHKDTPGAIASVTGILAKQHINIGSMNVYRTQKGSGAAMIIETDQLVCNELINELKLLPDLYDVIFISAE